MTDNMRRSTFWINSATPATLQRLAHRLGYTAERGANFGAGSASQLLVAIADATERVGVTRAAELLIPLLDAKGE